MEISEDQAKEKTQGLFIQNLLSSSQPPSLVFGQQNIERRQWSGEGLRGKR